MAPLATILVGIVCLLLFHRLASYYRPKLRRRPPPGPPGLPLVGNVLDVPRSYEYPWLKYRDWCREYNSDIIRLNALGSNIIVLNSLKAANALLDRRSEIYSGRPRMVMLNELAGFDWDFGNLDYGEDWRVCRKMMHHELRTTPFKKYRPILAQNAHELVRRITKEPLVHVPVHLKHMTGANIMQVTYGIKVLPEHDPFIEISEVALEAFSKCAIDFHVVDALPFLKCIPTWFPGAGFKRRAAVWHQSATRQLNVPYADYLRREESGIADDCMAKALAEAYASTEKATERREKMTAATMYLGGSESIAAAMHTFFSAMLLYPDVQARARQELDAALGPHRLPTFEDFGSVPYIDALIKELLRWKPVISLNVPHKLREDDVYDGYHLEKDSLVIVNNWSILHDAKVYPDPHTFAPDRFLKDGMLNPDILDPQDVAFGFGRRICPGMSMAYDTLWIAITTVLVCTEICLAKDSAGREIAVKEDFPSAFVTEPRPFPCHVRFRSDAHAALLDQM